MHVELMRQHCEDGMDCMYISEVQTILLQVTHGYQAAAMVTILCWRCLSAQIASMKQLSWKLP